MKKEFQVEQNYGQGSKGWVYFEIDESATDQEIMNQAVRAVRDDWDKQHTIPFNLPPCRPKILINEYKDGKSVRGGIRLKTRWR